jgi:hypothetical protein
MLDEDQMMVMYDEDDEDKTGMINCAIEMSSFIVNLFNSHFILFSFMITLFVNIIT